MNCIGLHRSAKSHLVTQETILVATVAMSKPMVCINMWSACNITPNVVCLLSVVCRRFYLSHAHICIRTFWKYTQVLFSELICTATIKSSRIVRYSDTNNIQSSHHRQADVRSQRLERLHQSLWSSAYWRSHSPGKTLRLLWLWFTTVWWTVRQCWRTTIW